MDLFGIQSNHLATPFLIIFHRKSKLSVTFSATNIKHDKL
jgi:hypothetical protein